jgi:hypothetical protein
MPTEVGIHDLPLSPLLVMAGLVPAIHARTVPPCGPSFTARAAGKIEGRKFFAQMQADARGCTQMFRAVATPVAYRFVAGYTSVRAAQALSACIRVHLWLDLLALARAAPSCPMGHLMRPSHRTPLNHRGAAFLTVHGLFPHGGAPCATGAALSAGRAVSLRRRYTSLPTSLAIRIRQSCTGAGSFWSA